MDFLIIIIYDKEKNRHYLIVGVYIDYIEFYDKIGEDSYYNRIVVDRYPWSKAMLLYPVPYNEMQKSKLTVQNPLWN